MSMRPLEASRFVRRTQLGANEYRKNFHQIDREVVEALTSAEADRVTPLMSKVYLCMVNAPAKYWERDGVLRIEAEVREGKLTKAWAVLCDLVGVASATASKAIRWMHEQGIIGYFSGKNGVGLRIFLNRAASSVGARQAQAGKKILSFPPASFEEARGSLNEPAFNDSFAVSEVLETDFNSLAPKNGAEQVRVVNKSSASTGLTSFAQSPVAEPPASALQTNWAFQLNELVRRLKGELEPLMQAAAREAATREHERTREWLEKRGLPKAARVAQHEAYNVLKKHGLVNVSGRSSSAHAEVGRTDYTPTEAHPLSQAEVSELAEVCVAMLETKGLSVEHTLAEMSAGAGGFLLPADAVRVRETANTLLSASRGGEGN